MGREARFRLAGCLGNGQEIAGFQAGSANKRAINIGDRHQLRRIRRLDRTTVEKPDRGARRAEALAQLAAQERMHVCHVVRRRRQSRADRPDRLIGNDAVFRRRTAGNRSCKLAPDHVEFAPCPALRLRLADADDRDETRTPCGLRLGRDGCVVLAVIGAPLRMSDDHQAGVGIGQHFRRQIAGMGATRRRMAILRPDSEPAVSRDGGSGGDQRRRRTDRQVDPRSQPVPRGTRDRVELAKRR